MRQRLGLAAALLKDPELLILDEPANGLDPAGIRDVRELVRRLADEGRTVFLSSHLLSEVEQVCDEVAIVSAGRTVAQGAVNDVLARARPAALWVKVTDLAGATAALCGAQGYEPSPMVTAYASASSPNGRRASPVHWSRPVTSRASSAPSRRPSRTPSSRSLPEPGRTDDGRAPAR